MIPDLLKGSSIEISSSWTPGAPSEEPPTGGPMDLGTAPGGPNRLVQILFVNGDPMAEVDRLKNYTDSVEKAGLADTQLVAPFLKTIPGTDTYVDQI